VNPAARLGTLAAIVLLVTAPCATRAQTNTAVRAGHATGSPPQPADALLLDPTLLGQGLDAIIDGHPALHLEWLSSRREGLQSTRAQALTLLGEPIGALVLRGTNGVISSADISLYNRGDDGDLTPERFDELVTRWQARLQASIAAKPRIESTAGAVTLKRVEWTTGPRALALEYSQKNGRPARPEFLRIRIGPAATGLSLLAGDRPVTAVLSLDELPRKVVRETDGTVWIPDVPMVDQGEKGYCAVATTERVLRYFGIAVDANELAQIADSSAAEGTSAEAMQRALKRATGRIKARTNTLWNYVPEEYLKDVSTYNNAARRKKLTPFDPFLNGPDVFLTASDTNLLGDIRLRPASLRQFEDRITQSIQRGLPVLWACIVGVKPEENLPQSRGGHMRLIIGINPRTRFLVYSDSWGAGHERKTMPLADALYITTGLYVLSPIR
jgi:hypothetical protein